MRRRTSKLGMISVLVMATALSACSGGGGASGPSPVPTPIPEPEPTPEPATNPRVEAGYAADRAAWSETTGVIYKALPGEAVDPSTQLSVGATGVSGYAVRENLVTGEKEIVSVSGEIDHALERYDLDIGGLAVSGTRADDEDEIVFSYVAAGSPQAAGYADTLAALTQDGEALFLNRAAVVNPTRPADMPVSGTATFTGISEGYLTYLEEAGYSGRYVGDVTSTADFSDATVDTRIDITSAPAGGGSRDILSRIDISGSVISGSEITGGTVAAAGGNTAFVGAQTASDVRGAFGGVVEGVGGPASLGAVILVEGETGSYQGAIRADR